jgi:hypothetical protein
MRKRPRLHLVGQDPADVFEDLDRLRSDMATPPQRRPRAAETFARIPHDKALTLYKHKLSGAAWVVLIEIDRLILKAGGQNPVKLSSWRLREIGLSGGRRDRAVRELEAAGVIVVRRCGRGHSPWAFHSWYPQQHG